MSNKKIKNIPGYSNKNLNTKVRPQDDFFEYACGGWIKQNPIPDDKSNWSTFTKLRDDVSKKLRLVVRETQKKKSVTKGSEEQLVRDLYESATNMKLRNKLGILPVQKYLDMVEEIQTSEDIVSFITDMHAIGFGLVWGTGVGSDDKKSNENITLLWQGGLTLPDREFYLKKDKQSVVIRKEYVKHITKTLMLSGYGKKEATHMATSLLAFETKIAKISLDKVSCRNIENLYHKFSVKKINDTTTGINWENYFEAIGLTDVNNVLVYMPDYLSKVTKLISKQNVEDWKIYLYWHVLHDASGLLSEDFVKENFNFFGKILSGQKEMEPLWKRGVGAVNSVLGEALGKEYVKHYFTKEAKKEMDLLVKNLVKAYKKRIKNLDWMSPKTKEKALTKLSLMNPKIGYPKKWLSYRGLVIKPDTYFENMLRASLYEKKRDYKKLGKKVDRDEWHMYPQTVNAYYAPNLNDIVFPAGILQPPFFSTKADAAINYGAIGSVIGHEMTHGFDDNGAKFDGHGNFKNWWTKKDIVAFTKKTKVLVNQFNSFKIGELNVNGKLTLGENIADLGGIHIAYDAYQEYMKTHGRKNIGGWTPEQRFFLGLVLFECGHYRPEFARTLIQVDVHAPSKLRINAPLSNLQEFHDAFEVTSKDKLFIKENKRAKIW